MTGWTSGARGRLQFPGAFLHRASLHEGESPELGGVSLDNALNLVLFEHLSRAALTRLAADPAGAECYLAESAQLAEVE